MATEWKTTGVGKYVPPSMRTESEKMQQNLTQNDFPTLGAKTTPNPNVTKAWGQKTSFTQKIKDLIAYEQQTEAEKEAAEEAAKEMNGYVILSLKFDEERYIKYNEFIAKHYGGEKSRLELANLGCGGPEDILIPISCLGSKKDEDDDDEEKDDDEDSMSDDE